MENRSQSHLEVREWIAIWVILGFLALLTFASIESRLENHIFSGQEIYLKAQEIELFIEGAVKKPGTYRVPSGTFLLSAIQKAEPLPTADLSKIRDSTKARSGQKVIVPTRAMINVRITGAVASQGRISLPKGTRLCELLHYIEATENADLSKLTSKRILKEGEEIIIPVKPIAGEATVKNRKKRNVAF